LLTSIALLVAACTVSETPAPAPERSDAAGPQYAVDVEVSEEVARVRVEPRGAYHMNTEFPIALDVQAPAGVDVRAVQTERFDEQGLVFAVPLHVRTGGKKRFGGTVEFAVCGDAACAPQKVPVDFTLDVPCDTDAVC
jgi:hypothetical protein